MLRRIPRVSYASRLLKRRYATKPSKSTTKISTVTSPSSFWAQTFKKVTAYPFSVTPREAQVFMETLGIIADNLFLLILFKYRRQEGPLVKLLSHYVRYKTRNDPVLIKPVYVPIWRLFTFVNFRPVNKEGVLQDEKSMTLLDVCMPGTHTPDHLSRAPFWRFPEIQDLETKPIGECIKPFGMDAQCLPFTISPFAPFDLAKSIENKPIPLTGGKFTVLPSSVFPEFYAAFPVMVPVYTREYPSVMRSGKRGPFTFVCQAFGMAPHVPNLFVDTTHEDDPEGDIKILWWRTASNHVKKLAKTPPLQNDDDPCIRPLNEEELDPVVRLGKVRESLNEWYRIDTTNWPSNRRNEYRIESKAREKRYFQCFPSWWWESKLCPDVVKEAAAAVEGKPKPKPKRPAKSRSRPI